MKSMLNFESKLEKDLNETTSALVGHMKKHSILSQNNITLMKPIEKLLLGCFDQMKRTQIEESKNYFAMSLKLFFQSLSDDQLEIVCHNYVHNWINQELKEHNRLLNKYQQEQMMDYVNKKNGVDPDQES